MNKSNILGIVLIFLLIGLYSWWNYKPLTEEEKLAQEQRRDSIMRVQLRADSIRLVQAMQQELLELNNQEKLADLPDEKVEERNKLLTDKFGAFANSALGEEEFYTVETEKLKLTFTNLGGKLYSVQLKEFQTYDSLPLILFEGKSNHFGISFFSNNRLIETEKLFFTASENNTEIIVTDESGYHFDFKVYPLINDSVDKSKYIEYSYYIPYNDYMIDVSLNMVGMGNTVSSHHGLVDLLWSVDMRQQEKSKENRLNGTNIYYKFTGDKDVNNITENKDGNKKLPVKTQWVSFKQQFFTSSLIAKNGDAFMSGEVTSEVNKIKSDNIPRYNKTMKADMVIPYSGEASESFDMSMYFGPNKFKELKKYDIQLEDQINLGNFFLVRWINRYGVLTVFNFLEQFNWNYGLIILILTLMLKLILFPITYKSYMNGAKMRAIKPELDVLNAKYPSQDDAMKKQQETMAVYKKFGINPMSGCLPQLLQFPILIAMFRFFPVSFELRQQSFLWATDLSSYDSILDLPFNIPFYGNHVSLFTLLMTVSTIIYTRINNKTMGQTNQPGVKFMLYLMPIMFLGIFNSYPAALSYYYLLTNLITFAQMYIIGKVVSQEKLRDKMLLKAAATKANPKKGKSKWQQKLEEMQKMQQAQARENAKRKK
ncbi:membrane protein insertase YidC [Bacteroidales bacterium OttesenSCG-928-K03]|nr:membrane protein insertase YidC [Odoribacter sp. OttesenSCG-928-L07]MDL2239728.1 membrane protein insertase YidC [Bacteroidales bacterium OttesenSCG-928-L14]MDL2242954.1 membrane protein insertase YidC [Bacteroidales bacterium OttesenSCG-928-K03]